MPGWMDRHFGGVGGQTCRSGRVGGLLRLGPSLEGGEVGHAVVLCSLIQLSTLLQEGQAAPVLTGMAVAAA